MATASNRETAVRREPQDTGPGGIDRRSGVDRRSLADAEASNLERRRGPGRRLSDFLRAAEEGELTREQFLFVVAIEEFKRVNGQPRGDPQTRLPQDPPERGEPAGPRRGLHGAGRRSGGRRSRRRRGLTPPRSRFTATLNPRLRRSAAAGFSRPASGTSRD